MVATASIAWSRQTETRSVSIARLEQDWEKAKLKGQGEIVRWASQHLNIEIGLALRSDRWAGADFWGKRPTTL